MGKHEQIVEWRHRRTKKCMLSALAKLAKMKCPACDPSAAAALNGASMYATVVRARIASPTAPKTLMPPRNCGGLKG